MTRIIGIEIEKKSAAILNEAYGFEFKNLLTTDFPMLLKEIKAGLEVNLILINSHVINKAEIIKKVKAVDNNINFFLLSDSEKTKKIASVSNLKKIDKKSLANIRNTENLTIKKRKLDRKEITSKIPQAKNSFVSQSINEVDRLLDITPVGVVLVDLYGIIVAWNKFAEKIFMTSEKEILGKQFILFFEDKEKISEFISYKSQKKFKQSLVVKTVRGQFIEFNRSIVTTNTGGVAVLLTCSDITERRRNEEELRFLDYAGNILSQTLDYKTRLNKLAKLAVPVLGDYCIIDIFENNELVRVAISHHDPEKEKLLIKLLDFIPKNPDPHPLLSVLKTGAIEFIPEVNKKLLESIAHNKDHLKILKELNPTSYICAPLMVRGRIIGAITVATTDHSREYTDYDVAFVKILANRAALSVDNGRLFSLAQEELKLRNKLEAELQKANIKLHSFFQGVADGVTVQDSTGKIVYANSAACKMMGFSSIEELLATPINQILDKYQLLDEKGNTLNVFDSPGKNILKGEESKELMLQFVSKYTKEKRWAMINAKPITNNGKTEFVVNTMRDVTDTVEEEKRRDHFISIASHELKTPLAAVKAFAQILQKRLKNYDDFETVQFLQKIDNQVNKVTKLINDLLDQTRIRAGKLEIYKEKFDFNELLQETVESLQELLTSHRIIIQGNIKENIFGDKNRLSQVIINFISNAVKYSGKGKKIIVTVKLENDWLECCVKDFGDGISQDKIEKIFEPYFQGKQKSRSSGLGLGLYISSEIIRLHGGKIWVESKERKGSSFYFKIPIQAKKSKKASETLFITQS